MNTLMYVECTLDKCFSYCHRERKRLINILTKNDKAELVVSSFSVLMKNQSNLLLAL